MKEKADKRGSLLKMSALSENTTDVESTIDPPDGN
jgi:hypothetical protein